jgi:hypothetical protein
MKILIRYITASMLLFLLSTDNMDIEMPRELLKLEIILDPKRSRQSEELDFRASVALSNLGNSPLSVHSHGSPFQYLTFSFVDVNGVELVQSNYGLMHAIHLDDVVTVIMPGKTFTATVSPELVINKSIIRPGAHFLRAHFQYEQQKVESQLVKVEIALLK